MKRLVLVVFHTLFTVTALADWGTEFVTAVPNISSADSPERTREVFLTCSSHTDTTVSVTSDMFSDITTDLNGIKSWSVRVDTLADVVVQIYDIVTPGKTIHITANPAAVSCFWVISAVNSDPDYTGSNESMWEIQSKARGGGTEFQLVGFDRGNSMPLHPLFLVINQEQNDVSVTCTSEGSPISFVLKPEEVVMVSTYWADQYKSDTIITDGTVTVVSGADQLLTYNEYCCHDGVAAPGIPLTKLGYRHYVTPFPVMDKFSAFPYIVKVISHENGTLTADWGSSGTVTIPITAGTPILFNNSSPTDQDVPWYDSAGVFSADVSIEVMQTSRSHDGTSTNWTQRVGDAGMDGWPPAEELSTGGNVCVIPALPVEIQNRHEIHEVTIIARGDATISDGVNTTPISGWETLPDGAQYARVPVDPTLTYMIKSSCGVFCRLTVMTDNSRNAAGEMISYVPSFWDTPRPTPVITALDPVVFCASDGASCRLDAGAGFVSYQWQFGGVDLPGATGQTYTASATGDYNVTVTDANGCTGTSTPVTLNADNCPSNPPGEVSCQLDGEPPLLAVKGDTITVEKEPNATAYNVYADSIGSWYFPTQAKGSVCTIRSWTDNGDGTITFPFTIPDNSWIVVTASNPDGEGPAGDDSSGVERTTIGVWELCGPAP